MKGKDETRKAKLEIRKGKTRGKEARKQEAQKATALKMKDAAPG
ncbi:MAG: hypothetical protein ACRD4H_10640 [Candidatus Acidiferrales bacterium]